MRSFLLVLFLMTSITLFAKPHADDFPFSNIPDLQTAEKWADQLIAAHRSGELEAVLITHVGNTAPHPLKYLTMKLQKNDVPYTLDLVTQEEFKKQIETMSDGANKFAFRGYKNARVTEQTSVLQSLKDSIEKTKLNLKYIYGVPNGISFWSFFKNYKRSKGLKKLDIGLSTISAATSILSGGASLYIKGEDVSTIATATSVLAGWVWVNSYYAVPMFQAVNQGISNSFQSLKGGISAAKRSWMFNYSATLTRSMLTNAIFIVSAFGLGELANTDVLMKNLQNCAMNSFARIPVETWLHKKLPDVAADGSIHVNPAKKHWTMKKWSVVNATWLFLYGVLRLTDLFGKDIDSDIPYGDIAFYTYMTMTVVGVAKSAYDYRDGIKEISIRLKNKFTGFNQRLCKSALYTLKNPLNN